MRAARIDPGVPHYNTVQDAVIRALPAYDEFAARLSRVRRLWPLYGRGENGRLALAFAYAAARTASASDPWPPFWRELVSPVWTCFAIANLLNFSAEDEVLDFEDGLQIRSRDYAAIDEVTSWGRDLLDATVGDDLMRGFGFGTHVVIALESLPKSPSSVVQAGTGSDWPRIARLLLALQLAARGDVGIGRPFHGRRDRMRLLGGYSSWARPGQGGPGEQYQLSRARVPKVRALHRMLIEFDGTHRTRMANIATALDRFAGTFDKAWAKPQDLLIDDVIALEAVVGTKDELAFTIAFRVSGMLEPADSARVETFRRLKSFYSTRSDLVHGSTLKARALADLGRERDLRDLVRRLLRGLLPQIGGTYEPTPSFVAERLDTLLLDPTERGLLSTALQF